MSCVNGANCVDAYNWYTCACVAGYTGLHCETGERMGMANTYNYMCLCTVNVYYVCPKDVSSGQNIHWVAQSSKV